MPTAGYSGTPLCQKLGIKPGFKLHPKGAPAGYKTLLAPLPPDVSFATRLSQTTDLAHLFTTSRSELSRTLVAWRKTLKPNGTVWVSWPKQASGVKTDITEQTIRDVALPLGFVDVKVCAVDGVWSGLKLVIRKELRLCRSPT